jgi:two-component system, LytTR family, sensor kinase
METIKFNKKIINLHIFNWLMVMIIRNIIITPFEEAWNDRISQGCVELLVFATAYYFFCIIISPLIARKQWKKYLWLLIIYIILWDHAFFLSQRILGMIYFNNYTYLVPNLSESVWTSLYICAIAFLAHGFYQKQISIQRLIAQSEREQIGLMQELLFFKNQFNDHISFNFLNYCYRQVIKKDLNASKAIETYSEMLRYTLSAKPDEIVPLQSEILYIEQFISLQKQIGKEVAVNFLIKGDYTFVYILPRVLVNFIENAFKYGISDELEKPININLEINERDLFFKISNYKKKIKEAIKSTGTGQQNSVQQLNLYYQNNYILDVTEDKNMYHCSLKIKLK